MARNMGCAPTAASLPADDASCTGTQKCYQIGKPAAGKRTCLRAEAAGTALAAEVLTETAEFLTIWLGTIVDLLEPDVMVIGGGVAELMSIFFARMSAGLSARAINRRAGAK